VVTERTPHLSVLDLSVIPEGSSASQALHGTVESARHVEKLGFTRYWLAEHHNAATLASSCPEVLIARVASATNRMRVGAGGIMLPNHSPLKVAETFRVLEALFPGRIDLGLGRAAGTDPRAAALLRRGDVSVDEFPEELSRLSTFLDADALPREPFARSVVAIPVGVPSPELFVLSSSGFGVTVAAERGLGLAFAHHMNPDDAAAEIQRYVRTFRPSGIRAQPRAILSVAVVCSESNREAKELASSGELAGVRFAQGLRDMPLPSVAAAMAHAYDEDERSLRALHRMRGIVGDVDQVCSKLEALAKESQADELMLMTHVHDPEARARSYALVAKALGLRPRG